MAKTATHTEETLTEPVYIGVGFVSKSKQEDGSLLVKGKVTDDSLDLDKQIVDAAFATKALDSWFGDWANLRQMHSHNMPPAGTALELEKREDGHYITGRIVEPGAVLLCEQGVYKGFSVGIGSPRIVRDGVAQKGRIIDGVITEVSLVDRPANPACRFSVVKFAGDTEGSDFGGWEFVGEANDEAKTLAEAELAKAATADVTKATDGKEDEEHDDDCDCADCAADKAAKRLAEIHPDDARAILDDITRPFAERLLAQDFLVQKVALPDAEKKDFSDAERQKLADSGKALPDGSFPIETVGDLENAIHAYGRAKNKAAAKRHIIKRAEDLGATDKLPDDWKASKKSLEPSFALKRLHDVLCPCYSNDQVAEVYPAIEKNGLATTLGPASVQMLYEMLTGEVAEDGGKGKCAYDIKNIASAYCHLVEFVQSEIWEAQAEIMDVIGPVLAEARADLHKAFRELNGLDQNDVIPIEGPIQPGRFKRPFITAGRYRENPTSGARIPSPSPINSGQFDRAGYVAGQERQSPANKDLGAEIYKAPGGRVFYTNQFRDDAQAAMAAVHDHIAATFPDLCASGLAHATADPGDVFGKTVVDTRDAATLEPPALPALKDFSPEVQEQLSGLIKEAVTLASEPLVKRIDDLQEELDKVQGAPDPKKDPVRLSGVLSAEAVNKVAGADATDDSADKGHEGPGEEESLVDYIRKVAASPDPRTRELGLATLKKLGTTELEAATAE